MSKKYKVFKSVSILIEYEKILKWLEQNDKDGNKEEIEEMKTWEVPFESPQEEIIASYMGLNDFHTSSKEELDGDVENWEKGTYLVWMQDYDPSESYFVIEVKL